MTMWSLPLTTTNPDTVKDFPEILSVPSPDAPGADHLLPAPDIAQLNVGIESATQGVFR